MEETHSIGRKAFHWKKSIPLEEKHSIWKTDILLWKTGIPYGKRKFLWNAVPWNKDIELSVGMNASHEWGRTLPVNGKRSNSLQYGRKIS